MYPIQSRRPEGLVEHAGAAAGEIVKYGTINTAPASAGTRRAHLAMAAAYGVAGITSLASSLVNASWVVDTAVITAGAAVGKFSGNEHVAAHGRQVALTQAANLTTSWIPIIGGIPSTIAYCNAAFQSARAAFRGN